MQPVAVIELGTTSIRLAVAQIGKKGHFEILDSLQMAVAVGKDTFTLGRIERETTEECVQVLRKFREILQQYRITDPRHFSAVATSAVREAINREAFLERILVATGFVVRTIDQAEVNRYIYHAVRPALATEDFWRQDDTLVIEVGGGSTEALVFRRGRISDSHLYRLGSLRLHQTLEQLRTPGVRSKEIMKIQVEQTIEMILENISPAKNLRLVALGGEARFACARLRARWDGKGLARLPQDGLIRLTEKILAMSVDELVRRYQISYPDAEALGPALLVYSLLAEQLKLEELLVGEANVRSGIFAEMSTGSAWTADFKNQIIHSAKVLGRRYAVDPAHARFVANVCSRLYQLLRPEHLLEERDALILEVASLLHESGSYISRSGHHKHSFYIILNSGLFGLGSEDLLMAALIARYHRRALPQPDHPEYNSLPMDKRIRVLKMAAILRVADALDLQHSQRLRDIEFSIDSGRLIVTTRAGGNLDLEQHKLKEKSNLFLQVYGLETFLKGI